MLGTVERTWAMESYRTGFQGSLNLPSISSFKGKPDVPNWLSMNQSEEKEKQNPRRGVGLGWEAKKKTKRTVWCKEKMGRQRGKL